MLLLDDSLGFEKEGTFMDQLKDKLRHIKIFKSSFEQKIDCRGAAPNQKCLGKLSYRSQGKDLHKEGGEVKKGNYLIGYRLEPSWLFVIGCLYCLDFITLRHL